MAPRNRCTFKDRLGTDWSRPCVSPGETEAASNQSELTLGHGAALTDTDINELSEAQKAKLRHDAEA